jgi:hypothetical protein
MAKSNTFVAIDNDDVVFIEDKIVNPHWLGQLELRGSRSNPWGVPLALNFHWMLVGDEQASRKISETSCPERACYASYSSSLTTSSNDLIPSSDVFGVFGSLEPGYFITNSN